VTALFLLAGDIQYSHGLLEKTELRLDHRPFAGAAKAKAEFAQHDIYGWASIPLPDKSSRQLRSA
jgi:hypothetical protein